ncbi:MAG: 1-acyl-sn-glycerol-3-phosphate acyltransferase [Bdellovibrio sp.]|nr:MAG: 1-acyl-sn-glycerol-3-phosphate acyltransferase [Bdellovibrio sp.]
MSFLLKLLSYLRSVMASLFAVAFTGFYGFLCAFLVRLFPSRALGDFFIRSWAKVMLAFFGVRLRVYGLENLPQEGCVFVFNHTSEFDILAFHAAIPKSARFGAKIELFKVPALGASMRALGVLPISRGEKEKVFQLYKESVPRLHQGESFVLAAEGTRQRTHGVGARFKAGPFVFAIQAQVPLVPVVFVGAHEVLPKGKWLPAWGVWRPLIDVYILKPFDTKGLSLEEREAFQKNTQKVMTAAYTEARKEWLKGQKSF